MISFIVPVYNAEQYLKACIESLLHQTEQDIELVLVDDGSTDNSLNVIASFQDPRIKLFQQSHAGQSAARNLGLKHAKGEYVAFVDADDATAQDWCEKHIAAIKGVDYVQSGYTRNGVQKTPSSIHQFTSPCMRLYRRQAIEGMQFTEGMIYEDVIWSVDLWLRNLSCRRIAYTGYHYTVNPSSTTSTRHPEAEQRVFAELKKRVPTASLRGKRILWYTLIRLQIHFIKQ